MQDWKHLLWLFPAQDRYRIFTLLVSTTLSGLLQAVSVASIMPFIAVVAEPDLVTHNEYLAAAYARFGFENTGEFLVFLGLAAMLVLVVTNVLVAVNAWLTFRVCHIGEHDLSRRLLQTYLRSPWSLLLQRNSTGLLEMLMREIDRVVIGTMMAGIGVFADIVTTLFIVTLLLWIHPWVTLVTLGVLGAAYGLIYAFVIPRVTRLGKEFPALHTEAYRNAQEALAAAREIRVLGCEDHFVKRFSGPLLRLSRNSIRYSTLDIIPAQALELIAFGGLIAAAVWMISETDGAAGVVPTIAMFGFAAYRLIPALKDLFDGLEAIRYNMVALEPLWRDYSLPAAPAPEQEVSALELRESVRLEGVAFIYPNGRTPALSGVDLKIVAGHSHCFVGTTGAGKSTTVDILLGLLQPSAGRMLVDGSPLGEAELRAWQRGIGYCPQSVLLLDDTIASNIAFGVDAARIEPARLERAARIADIHDFIANELPEGYQTKVGERGASLSGGQRQRIGIARALYRDARVLVLDEATNELDLVTEARILQNLRDLGRRTLIFVSHRATVAAFCDNVAVFENGRVVAQADYRALAAPHSPHRVLFEESAPRPLA